MNENTNSHILVQRFDYYRPESVAEAVRLLVQAGPTARVLAGGTDLLVQMKMERTAPMVLVGLGHIAALRRATITASGLNLGALTTIRAIEKLPAVQTHYRALAEACAGFSSTQVATMGTLGGNLANASPASDTAPALIAFDAEIEIVGPAGVADGPCRLPLAQFFRGPGKPALEHGDVVTTVVLPAPQPGTGSAFLKATRVTNDIAKASCAVVLVRDAERVIDCRLVFGSVAPTPFRARGAEAALVGQVWNDEAVAAAAQLAASEIAPIDDIRSTAAYRREIVRVMTADALNLAWERAAGASADFLETWRPAAADEAPAAPAVAADRPVAVKAADRQALSLRINGRLHQAWVAPNALLLNVLREDLELTGAKYGCGIGECSACTVLLDGQPVLACLVLALDAAGHEITTIEGLASPDGTLDPLQDAFIDHAAYQCGYCTPGMLLTAKVLLAEIPQPEEEDVRHYLRGNMCRCTGYAGIVRAVLAAAEKQV